MYYLAPLDRQMFVNSIPKERGSFIERCKNDWEVPWEEKKSKQDDKECELKLCIQLRMGILVMSSIVVLLKQLCGLIGWYKYLFHV